MPVTSSGAFRRFPTGSDYATALQNTELCFRDSRLRGAQPDLTSLGLPKAISGNFASVFSLTAPGGSERYAVKCFTRFVPDQNDRYQAISRHLTGLPTSRLSQPWNMGFDYLPDEILVAGERYPVLRMEWVQGRSLASWLDRHHRESSQVGRVAEHFAALIDDLHTHGVAHGDLQHGNVLVAPDLTLRLVDYDGMYVPALAGRQGTEDGHRNYQSPLRGAGDFGPDMDHFASWIIWAALKAVAADGRLWADLHEPSGEYLLLSEEDYKAPAMSPRFARLLSHPHGDVARPAQRIAQLATVPVSAIPRLSTQMSGSGTRQQSAGARPATGTGLPDWLRDRVQVPDPTVGAPPYSQTPGATYRRRVRDVLALPVLLLSMTVPVLITLGIVSSGGLVTAGASVAAGMTFLQGARRSRPELRELRQQIRELERRIRAAQDPQAATAQLDREREDFERTEQQRAAYSDQQGQQLTYAHQQRLAAVERERQKQDADLRKQLARLDGEFAADLDRRLRRYQDYYVEEQLRHALIEKAKIPGIGSGLKGTLAAYGVLSAADFRDITLLSTGGSYNSVTAYVNRTRGSSVDIKGIGPTRARALEQWREQRVAAARSRQPSTLPLDQQRAAQEEFRRRKSDVRSRLGGVATQADAARKQAEQDMRQARERLRHEAEGARAAARGQREEFARQAVRIQHAAEEIPVLDAALGAARARRRRLTTRSYVRFLVTGRTGAARRS